AAFEVVLARHSGQGDLVVGTPVSLRDHPAAQKLLGFFVNTLPVRTTIADDTTFAGLVERVQAGVLEAFDLRDVPLSAIAAALRQGSAGAPPFRAASALGGDPSPAFAVPGLRAEVHELATGAARVELGLMLTEGSRIVHGHLEYDADLYDKPRIEALAAH